MKGFVMLKKLIILLSLALFANNLNCAAANRPRWIALSHDNFAEFIRNDGNIQCAICMENMTTDGLEDGFLNPNWPYRANCDSESALHVFHKSCIERVVGNTCPICRGIMAEVHHAAHMGALNPELAARRLAAEQAKGEQLLQACRDFNSRLILHYVGQSFEGGLGYSVNYQNAAGETPIMLVSMHYGLEGAGMIRYLLPKSAQINTQNNDRRNALYYAIDAVNSEVVSVLIEKGIDINSRDINGITPLAYAKTKSPGIERDRIIRYLILRGAVE